MLGHRFQLTLLNSSHNTKGEQIIAAQSQQKEKISTSSVVELQIANLQTCFPLSRNAKQSRNYFRIIKIFHLQVVRGGEAEKINSNNQLRQSEAAFAEVMLTSITARRTSQEAKNKLNDFTKIDEALMKALYSTDCLPEKAESRGEANPPKGGFGW